MEDLVKCGKTLSDACIYFIGKKNISTVNGFSYTSLSLFPCCFVRDKNTENIANEIIQ